MHTRDLSNGEMIVGLLHLAGKSERQIVAIVKVGKSIAHDIIKAHTRRARY